MIRKYIFLIFILSFSSHRCFSQDTLNVMTYNVLHYGDKCQGSNMSLHSYLKTIVQYSRPDVLGMVKAQVIKLSANDFIGVSPVGFADSILVNGLNAANVYEYDHAPIVNFSNDPDADMDLLFYNKNKLGYLSVVNLCLMEEDFNLYKFYYKDPNLQNTKDTTFLYFILNHTVSGTYSGSRDHQDSVIVRNIKSRFKHLPNLISMGDFNTHTSDEPGYKLLTATSDLNFIFSDPPYLDQKLSYPSNWQDNAGAYASYLNTSTREGTIPNACGSDGGAKGWYLHTLLSPWIVKGENYIKYIPNSYTTLGNDGLRVGRSINDSVSVAKNSSVPTNVLNALFQFSDKYPVMIKLALSSNTSGTSLPDPETNVVTDLKKYEEDIFIENPINNEIKIHFPGELKGQQGALRCYNTLGELIQYNDFIINQNIISLSANFRAGFYLLVVSTPSQVKIFRVVKGE